MTRVILASASPRRHELLSQIGVRFEVRVPDIDESPIEGEDPFAYVRRLAIEKAAAFRPDLILLDIGLPVLSGIDAARQILANDPQSRIMFMSANGSPAMVEAAMRMGVRGYLLKSDAHQLVAAMDAISQGQTFISERFTRRSET